VAIVGPNRSSHPAGSLPTHRLTREAGSLAERVVTFNLARRCIWPRRSRRPRARATEGRSVARGAPRRERCSLRRCRAVRVHVHACAREGARSGAREKVTLDRTRRGGVVEIMEVKSETVSLGALLLAAVPRARAVLAADAAAARARARARTRRGVRGGVAPARRARRRAQRA
jgi:hypothetical protein